MTLECSVRPEEPRDEHEIWHLTKRAFQGLPYAGGNEQEIVNTLRSRGALAISLVAEVRGRIVGHAAFSAALPEDSSPGWYTLGPMSVEPAFQRRGVGKALVRAGIARLRELGATGCIVVGDMNYYSQFGFVPAPENAPAGAPAEHYMILSLKGRAPHCRIDFDEAF